MEATIRHIINTRIQTEEEIELPDVVHTGDIINAVYNAMGNFEHYDYKEKEKFEIILENGLFFYCERLGFNKFSLYVEVLDEDGGYDERVADFMMIDTTL